MAKSEMESISIRPAKGGVISETAMRSKRGGKGGGGMYDYEHEMTVHPTMEHLSAHLDKCMGHCFGDTPKDAKGESSDDKE